MKYFPHAQTILILLFVLMGSSFSYSRELNRPLVAITAFIKLKNTQVENASGPIARRLSQKLNEIGIESYICMIPTDFKASNVARDCLNNLATKPDAVISLGVSRHKISLETTYRPSISSPEVSYATIPFDELIQSLSKEYGNDEFIRLSDHAGGWICDQTAYDLSFTLKSQNIPYGFIHVPSFYKNASAPENIIETTSHKLFLLLTHYLKK
ncbi:MAG: hypothetical protein V4654_02120 [Bdellovibrionota bacterium]